LAPWARHTVFPRTRSTSGAKKYGAVDVAAIKRLRELEQENARLKRLLAEHDLEVDVMNEVLAKNDGRAGHTRWFVGTYRT
jgi:hypothetical protein